MMKKVQHSNALARGLPPGQGSGEALQLPVWQAEAGADEGLQPYEALGVEASSSFPAPVHLLQLLSPALEEAEVEEDLSSLHQRFVVSGPVSGHRASIVFSAET